MHLPPCQAWCSLAGGRASLLSLRASSLCTLKLQRKFGKRVDREEKEKKKEAISALPETVKSSINSINAVCYDLFGKRINLEPA